MFSLDNLPVLLAIASAVVAGAILVLKVIAPLTKTTKDDAALDLLEKAEGVIDGAKPK